ncbi:CDP-glycerol glycerophosphotransferase family protein [Alteromonadaceae bacterium M269]|nr:CDP-glycerol glycerophosphotransferase family protein [Alteromonadaceae bacterium M269]
MRHYLLYICQNYAFEILRPLQREIHERGDKVAWFVEGNDVNEALFDKNEYRLHSIGEVKQFNPIAVFIPGNTVPSFIPGLKVQVFHGFEWKKKGHFRIRDCFDLYCTQGPLFTSKFNELKQQHPHFNVAETGWPKVDDLFTTEPYHWEKQKPLKTILYAPTFSPALTSSPALQKNILSMAITGKYQWLIKFHPKMAPELMEPFEEIESEYLHIVRDADISPLLQAADVMVSDTSSVITEFALLNKPVITYKNHSPEDHFIDIQQADELEHSLDAVLSGSAELLERTEEAVQQLHPYNDGKSSQRIIDATLDMINVGFEGLEKKPANIIRNLKLRKKLGYWKL